MKYYFILDTKDIKINIKLLSRYSSHLILENININITFYILKVYKLISLLLHLI